MSLTNIKTLFRTRLEGQSFEEWQDAFNFENIPNSIVDKAFHIQIGGVTGDFLNGENQSLVTDVIIRMFFKGFRSPAEGIDTAIEDGENVILDICDPTVRLGTNIKNVKFLDMSLEPFEDTNDNLILVTQNYQVTTVLQF